KRLDEQGQDERDDDESRKLLEEAEPALALAWPATVLGNPLGGGSCGWGRLRRSSRSGRSRRGGRRRGDLGGGVGGPRWFSGLSGLRGVSVGRALGHAPSPAPRPEPPPAPSRGQRPRESPPA